MTAHLSPDTLSTVPAAVARPGYDRSACGIGIVHFGPGAFHRAHQAVYTDDALALEGGDWAISAVSLKSPGVRDALVPQDGLYTLVTLDRTIGHRVIGSIREVLCAPEAQERVLDRLAAPATRVVTITVTEKGYCLTAAGELDTAHPDIIHDLAHPETPVSVIGYIVAGLRRRRAAGLPPYTVISCDNMTDNGQRLGRATAQYAAAVDAGLGAWVREQVAFPSTMVDSITPATDDALRQRVVEATGLADAWPIQREAFTQWVIEDRFCNGRPAWDKAGAILTNDVGAFGRAKLRLLNGPHSALAYLGSLAGVETVAEAMTTPELAGFLERLMLQDVLPTVTPPLGYDLARYAGQILERFRNPAIRHLLSQIAWDGSQKLPYRLFGVIEDRLAQGHDISRPALVVAGWMHFVRRRAAEGAGLTDPLASTLLDVAGQCDGTAGDVDRFLALEAMFARALAAAPHFRDALKDAYTRLGNGRRDAVLAAVATI
ncbi:mannitol dehydrogenase family protein [Nitrospirillum sp. BR 11828]|uniref:mannitol dehydrogenase family protein n=1 Tax=Nitrospirillum sp. BR 11828 TaxID=3104325 RepID=UPI002ACAFB27|nr:mannitol dehydrogenase family protein [Nitrospirillum sp. BR 11828]MDZ5647909.1 mannitol dehydrogenase family protein [Nitrospirillum sp. BR 11828]